MFTEGQSTPIPLVTLISGALLVLSLTGYSQPLERRAFLGVQVGALTEAQAELTDYGVNIVRVYDNSTASRFGLEAGQVILSANGTRLQQITELPRTLGGLRSGTMVRFELLVDGETVTRDLELQAFPEEQVAGARVIYDSIETVNGRQRTLLTLPDEAEQPPVVYILQGFGCASIDLALSQDQSLITLVDTLNSEGYATYRVEKTGLGDSEGRSCLEIGFDDETAGFAQGLQVLQQTEAVDTSRVYLLGISLGGVWAPMLAADTEVAGIMSFSTIAKTWPEYMYDNWRRQWELAGRSYGDIDRDLKLANLFWQQLITEGRSPSEIFSAYPETASLQTALAHDTSNENILSRHYTFVREFASTNIMSYWEAVDVPTLLLWGRGDYVASESDQQIIFRALQRRDVDVELRYLDTDHYWRIAADFLSSYRGLRDGERAPLQETVYENVVAWLTRTDAARKS